MNQKQLDGITKARLIDSIAQVQSGQSVCKDDAEYIAKVCSSAGLETLPDYAADSYAEQHAGKTIAELEAELAAAIDAARDKPNAPDLPTPVVDGVPTSVDMVQARLALLDYGVTAVMVEGVMDAMPEPDRTIARIEWEFRPRVSRHSALVLAVGAALSLDDGQIDALFVAAAAK